MNKEEQKTLDKLYELIVKTREENKALGEALKSVNDKVDKKHEPIYLEKDILQVLQVSMNKAIQDCLSGYSSPLTKLVNSVVESRSTELRKIIADSFDNAIEKDEFKSAIREGFSHKIARTLINNNGGLFDKVSNELKQDAVFKSKMAIAVANVVEECMETRKSYPKNPDI